MRRPLLIIFIILLIVCFIYTNININNELYCKEEICIVGTVKYKKKKDKYDEYTVENFLVRDYTKNKNIKVGSEIKLTGKLKNINDMVYDDFNYVFLRLGNNFISNENILTFSMDCQYEIRYKQIKKILPV